MRTDNFQPFGIIGMDDKGTFVYLPIRTATHIKGTDSVPKIVTEQFGAGSIHTPPTQEEIDIADQKDEDYSVDGRLAKHKKREKETDA